MASNSKHEVVEVGKNNPAPIKKEILTAGDVGTLVEMGVLRGRMTRPDIKLGICGEHGGDAASIRFFEQVGLDYVSCSPYRVPAARLAAAQASILARHDSATLGT